MSHTVTRTETREERFLRLLNEAADFAREHEVHEDPEQRGSDGGPLKVRKMLLPSTREHAVALTNLDTAILWAKDDLTKKLTHGQRV